MGHVTTDGNEGQERRAAPRVAVVLPVHFRVLGDEPGAAGDDTLADGLVGTTRDLSSGGLALVCGVPVADGALVALRLSAAGRTVRGYGASRWCRVLWRDGERPVHEVGVQFLAWAGDDRSVLAPVLAQVTLNAA